MQAVDSSSSVDGAEFMRSVRIMISLIVPVDETALRASAARRLYCCCKIVRLQWGGGDGGERQAEKAKMDQF